MNDNRHAAIEEPNSTTNDRTQCYMPTTNRAFATIDHSLRDRPFGDYLHYAGYICYVPDIYDLP